MKTTNKTCGIAAASAAVLLITAALITSCLEPLVGSPYQPPEGKGAIFLKLGDGSAARTILPNAPAFTRYAVSIQEYDDILGTTAVGSPITSNILSGAIATAIPLTPGFYQATVIGQTGTGFVNAATGTSAFFEITAGSTETVTVNMTAYSFAAGSGNGSLVYTITLGTGVTSSASVTRTLTALMGGTGYTDSGTAIPISPSSTETTLALPAGFYVITVTVPTAAGSASFNELLQIYQGLTTEFAYEFDISLWPAGNGVIIDPGFTPPSDANKPILSGSNHGTIAPDTDLDTMTTITLSKAATPPANEETITITNAAPNFQKYLWLISSGTFATNNANAVTITAGAGPFTVNNTYVVTAIGYNDATGPSITIGAWSTRFKVEITD